jgi:hypothetical protein
MGMFGWQHFQECCLLHDWQFPTPNQACIEFGLCPSPCFRNLAQLHIRSLEGFPSGDRPRGNRDSLIVVGFWTEGRAAYRSSTKRTRGTQCQPLPLLVKGILLCSLGNGRQSQAPLQTPGPFFLLRKPNPHLQASSCIKDDKSNWGGGHLLLTLAFELRRVSAARRGLAFVGQRWCTEPRWLLIRGYVDMRLPVRFERW